MAFAKTELSSLSNEFLNELKNDEDFKDFDRVIDYILRNKAHTLSEDREVLMASLSGFQAQDDIYSNLSDVEMEHGSFIDENGEEIKLSNGTYASFLKSPSQEIRKRVMKAFLAEYGKLNITFAMLYLSHVKYINFVAKEK